MIFSTFSYFLLLGVSVGTFFLVPKGWRRFILATTGIAFYSYFGGRFVILVAAETLVLYLLLHRRGIESSASTTQLPVRLTLLSLSLVLSAGMLVYFKYGGFVAEMVNELSTFIRTGLSLPVGTLAAPLAISFFTFEFIHVVVDRYRGKIQAFSLTELAAFVFFFPSLVAGPIKRFPDFNPQIDHAVITPVSAATGSYRILIGLVKKLVLADTLTTLSGTILTTSEGVQSATVTGVWLALFSFAWRIYFDFSGYSDIAIGSARLFGIILPENFNRPYLQTNIAAFWRNWHQTLTRWIIDYIYIPLGGSRRGLLSTCANTLVAMAVSGLWHGAALNFVFWGIYHGLLLVSYRLYKTVWRPPNLPGRLVPTTKGISTLVTFSLVSIGWLLFVAPLEVSLAAFTKLIGVTR